MPSEEVILSEERTSDEEKLKIIEGTYWFTFIWHCVGKILQRIPDLINLIWNEKACIYIYWYKSGNAKQEDRLNNFKSSPADSKKQLKKTRWTDRKKMQVGELCIN